ncbi:MAG: hypothetical protein RMK29_00675 [Myxococcales bacterium]|nr:hypothetical protein [Myxococcota bacterium]MDW8280191.1 hypothetical protein [Myxococcales bacterium]
MDSTLIDLVQAEDRCRPRSGRSRTTPAPGWTKDTPMLARTAADLIEHVPSVFETLPFSAAELREQEEEVRLLGNIKFVAEKIAAEAGTALAAGKTRLADHTSTVVDAVRAHLINPLTPRAVKKQLDRHAAPLFGLLEQRNATIQTTRNGRAALRSEADEARAEAERTALENRVLRGERLPGQVTIAPATPPRKAGRRTGRTTRRPA